MAITTYSELQTVAASRLSRVDLDATLVQECISLFEADAQDILETLEMSTTQASVGITGEYVAVPNGFVEVIEFHLNSPRKPIRHLTGDTQVAWYGDLTNTDAIFYEVVGSNFRFAPVPTGSPSATLTYRYRFAALSGSNTTNWLLTKYPDAYLYGTMGHLCEKTQDYALADRYHMKAQGILKRINRRARKSRWGAGLQVRPG